MNNRFVITCEDGAVAEVLKFQAICSSILEECIERLRFALMEWRYCMHLNWSMIIYGPLPHI